MSGRRLLLAGAVAAVTFIPSARPALPMVTTPATIVASTGAPLAGGGSATAFSLRLPERAACSGDSANANFRVQSYMVPVAVNAGDLDFGSQGPVPPATGAGFRQPLFTTTTSPYVNAQTANAQRPTDPGAVVNVPAFSLAVFAPGEVPAGTYNIGIACTRGPSRMTEVERVWNARITVALSAADAPAGITWTNDDAPAPAPPAAAAAREAQLRDPAQSADAAPARVARVQRSGPTGASGAPPSFGVPAFDFVRGLPLGPAGVALWISLAVVALRNLLALLHRPSREPVAATR